MMMLMAVPLECLSSAADELVSLGFCVSTYASFSVFVIPCLHYTRKRCQEPVFTVFCPTATERDDQYMAETLSSEFRDSPPT